MLQKLKIACLFTALFLSTTFVNKYVLSVLKFQYPTIFQGWQTLVGFLMLRALAASGRISLDTSKINRLSVALWLPAMVCYVISIYAGSVALSQLPIPTFLCLQNLSTLFTISAELTIQRKPIRASRYSILMLLLASAVMVILTDPQYNQMGYTWMTVHILTTGTYAAYEMVILRVTQLSSLDKIYCNYLYSVVILTPCSYFLGETLSSQHFPLWYYSRFYVGCILSIRDKLACVYESNGVFGVLLNLFIVHSPGGCDSRPSAAEQVSLGKIVTVVVSLFVFSVPQATSNAIWIAINLAMGCVFAFNESSHAKSDGSFDDRLVAPYVCIDAEPKVDEGTDVINT